MYLVQPGFEKNLASMPQFLGFYILCLNSKILFSYLRHIFHQPFPVSSVTLSLQSPHPPALPQTEVQVSTSSDPPRDLVTEEESPGHHVVEVAIPNVGTFVIESEEGGYDDEVAAARELPA